MGQLYYLAQPYSHESQWVMNQRFDVACEITAFLLKNGVNVFSPIVHSHPIAVRYKLPNGFGFWKQYDEQFIKLCTDMIIVKAEGWVKSVGVQAEIQMAKDFGLFFHYMDYPKYESWFIKERERGLI